MNVSQQVKNHQNFAEEYYDILTAQTNFVVFSSSKPAAEVMYFLQEQNIAFKPMVGRYLNQEAEVSYIVPTANMLSIIESDLIVDQECVLGLQQIAQQGLRKAVFVYANYDERTINVKDMGTFTPVSRSEAYNADGWTFDPHTGMYFTIKE